MNYSLRLIAVSIVVSAVFQLPTFADEIWTYRFTPYGSRPYMASCGECAWPYAGLRADVAGTFSILLNWESGTGKLFQLNDRLVNAADLLYTLPPMTVYMRPSNPSDLSYGILPPAWSTFPILSGVFGYNNGVGRLVSDGSMQIPGGNTLVGAPYDITFGPDRATLTMTVPILDHYITVTNATAAFVSATIAGDYNGDTRVDGRDYVTWRKKAGPQSDYSMWRNYFGTGHSSATANGSVPEPAAAILAASAAVSLCKRRVRRTRSNRTEVIVGMGRG